MQKLSNRITIRGKIYERDQVRAATVLLIPTMVVILFLFIIPAVQVV